MADMEDLDKFDASDILSSKNQTKGSIDQKKKGEFILPFADGTATLSGRNCEFRESTLRREQPVRSEDLRGQLQDEPEGFQPTETKDDTEARADFWSIQGDFIFRHHIEPLVLLYVPKEETCSIPPKYLNVTRLFTTQIWTCCKKTC